MNNSDCSYLFKEVHVSATILQALCASVIAAISVPIHLLLIVSMVIYHDNIENFMILFISFLVANTIVSIFLNGGIFFTPLILAWWFGCLVCKVLLSLWHVVCLLAGSPLHLTGSVEYSLLWSTLDIAKKFHHHSYGELLGNLTCHCHDFLGNQCSCICCINARMHVLSTL